MPVQVHKAKAVLSLVPMVNALLFLLFVFLRHSFAEQEAMNLVMGNVPSMTLVQVQAESYGIAEHTFSHSALYQALFFFCQHTFRSSLPVQLRYFASHLIGGMQLLQASYAYAADVRYLFILCAFPSLYKRPEELSFF